MRGKRMNVCLWAAAWGVATAGVVAGEKPAARGARSAAEPVDPDGTPIMILDASGSTAAGGGACDGVGAFQRVFSGINRFRGNVYRLTRNVTLLRFEMQLSFTGTTDLHFSIHRVPSGRQFPEYERVLPDVVRRFTGSGPSTPVSFSSGALIDPMTHQPGLRLEAGFDYAIGVTWGDELSVSYGRDQLTYPRPFSQGSVLGLVATTSAPPLPDTLANLGIFTSGAYAQRLCFAGACCMPNNTCVQMGSDACPGQPTAPGVTCDDVLAEGGCRLPDSACCTGSQSCLDVNRFLCEASDGVSRTGVLCGDVDVDPCAPRGGCCLPDGSCAEDVTRTRCGLIRGTYRGDGVRCDASPTCSAGACCTGNSCNFVLSPTECESAGGVFAGQGVSCSPNPCVPTGACCLGTTCQDGVTETDCGAQNGNYRGDDTTCDTIAPKCGLGACCEPGVGCTDGNPAGTGLTQTTCTILRGTFLGDGSTCAQDASSCKGTCCRSATLCTDLLTPRVCDAQLGGSFAGYAACSTAPCSGLGATGACCLPDGGCTKTTDSLCVSTLNGAFEGVGVACSTVDCTPPVPTGACCTDSPVACTPDVAKADCTGRWIQGAPCGGAFPPPCERRGACCDRTDPNNPTCTDDVLETDCQGTTRTFTADTACTDVFPPCDEPIGACCDVNVFQCLDDVVAAACLGAGRTWTPDTGCDQLVRPCVAPGACCLPTPGTCANLFEDECLSAGGVFGGSETDCVPNPCLNIVSTSPTDCAIDARQPTNVDGSGVNGSDRINITFDGAVHGLTATDFMAEFFPEPATPPKIGSVLPGGDANTVTIVFDQKMFTQTWTCVTHINSGRRTCVGFLPADVDGSRFVEPAVVDDSDPANPQSFFADITGVAVCTDAGAACGLWSCDTDRSGSCTPADILREIDLISGAGSLGIWLDKAIVSCPNTPTP